MEAEQDAASVRSMGESEACIQVVYVAGVPTWHGAAPSWGCAMNREARMRVFLVTIVVLALLAGACSGGSQFRRYRVFDFAWSGGPLAAGDTVVCDFYAQGEAGEWVKVADDVPWPDVTVDLVWPVPPADAWALPGDHTPEQMRVDVQALIGVDEDVAVQGVLLPKAPPKSLAVELV